MAVQLSASPPAWYQITYTSADSVMGARGGWGVKEITPGTPAEVVELLRRWATTRLVEVVETSQFASDDVLRERPRRLLSRQVDGRSCLWHATTAGLDATGRPGNVFTHAAAAERQVPLLRPIEYWRSSSWLSPFGVIDVNAARLGELVPGGAVTRRSVVTFLRESDRLFSLEWLLAAVAHVVSRRSTLVLATGSTDEAALWLGSISYLTSAHQARRIGWVTYQRAADLEAAIEQDLRIICIPREDLEVALEGAGPDRLVLDPSWAFHDPGDRSDWRFEGQSFPVANWWQNSVLDAFALDDSSLLRVLAQMDELMLDMADRDVLALPLHWALSTSLLSDPEAVVSARDELREECLSRVDRAALSMPLLRGIAGQAMLHMSGEDEAKLRTHPVWGPIIEHRAEREAVESYLAGGWQRGEQPPTSKASPSLVRRAAQGHVSEILRLAAQDAAGTATQLMAAARVVSTLLNHVVEGDPDPEVATVAATIKARLSEARFDAADLWPLHPDLLPEIAPASGPAGSSVALEKAHSSKTIAASARADVQAGELFQRTLPPDVILALEQLREDAGDEDVRQHAIDDCLLVAVGLRAVPLRGVSAIAHEDRLQAEKLLSDGASSSCLRQRLVGWLACYWVMVDVFEVEADPLPGRFGGILEENRPVVTSDVARFLLGLPDVDVAKALAFALWRDIQVDDRSLLSWKLEADSLGVVACRSAWRVMSEDRRRSILELARSDLRQLEEFFPDQVEPRLSAFRVLSQSSRDEPMHRRLRAGKS